MIGGAEFSNSPHCPDLPLVLPGSHAPPFVKLAPAHLGHLFQEACSDPEADQVPPWAPGFPT